MNTVTDKYIIFDTETTGLGRSKDGVKTEPYIVQLSWVLWDNKLKRIENIGDRIIKIPEEVEIEEGSLKVHGITKNDTQEKGVPIEIALEEFDFDLNKAKMMVAHNIDFDKRMVIGEYKRNKKFNYKLSKLPAFCTMTMGTNLCNLKYTNRQGKEKIKSPKLKELYKHLFDSGVDESKLHNALVDVIVAWRCFCKMHLKYDMISDEDPENLYEGLRKYYKSLL